MCVEKGVADGQMRKWSLWHRSPCLDCKSRTCVQRQLQHQGQSFQRNEFSCGPVMSQRWTKKKIPETWSMVAQINRVLSQSKLYAESKSISPVHLNFYFLLGPDELRLSSINTFCLLVCSSFYVLSLIVDQSRKWHSSEICRYTLLRNEKWQDDMENRFAKLAPSTTTY